MEYLVFWGVAALFLLFIFCKGAWDAHRKRQRFERGLFENYGKMLKREYKLERFYRLDRYFRKHPAEGQIDDITWNDLNMDEIFKRMNHTLSSTGEEYLYYALRTPRRSEKELEHLEEMTTYFDQHARERVDVQLLLHRLGTTGDYSLYDYLEYLGNLGKRSNWKHLTVDLLIVLAACLCFFQFSLGIMAVVLLMVYHVVTYFKEKGEIDPYVVSFAYILRLLGVCEDLVKLPISVCGEEWERIRRHRGKLASLKNGAFWMLSSGNVSLSSNPLDILMDYVRMTFHLDIIVFNRMLSQLNKHLDDVDALVGEIGSVECAICVGAYRASIREEDGWCVPRFVPETRIVLEEGYHPLIKNAVKNTVRTSQSVLITGSNASGKSTFLKTVAMNAILAQTIHTCCAAAYEAPFFQVLSSMTLRDDLESGESYYIVEVKSLKRILDAASGEIPVLCFVDEVLRGTNTVERIAASTQILKSMTGRNLFCFAATHDIELTELLKEDYRNYHFEEEIREGDIFFPYKLMEGKATTRNAIKLLELLGYDEEIIRKATRQAERFVITGKWEAV